MHSTLQKLPIRVAKEYSRKDGGQRNTNTHTPFPQKKLMGNFNFANGVRTQSRGGRCRPPTSSFSHKMEKKFFDASPPFLPPLVFQKGLLPSFYNAKGRQAWKQAKKVPMEYSESYKVHFPCFFSEIFFGFLDFFFFFFAPPCYGKVSHVAPGEFSRQLLFSFLFLLLLFARGEGGGKTAMVSPEDKRKRKREKLEVVVSGVRENEVRSPPPMGHKERRRRK